MKICGVEIEEKDVQTINAFIVSYQEMTNVILDLQKQLDEIKIKKQVTEEKLEMLKNVEMSFLDRLEERYNIKITADELLKIIFSKDDESSNMCNC